jgi:hypothetical protein
MPVLIYVENKAGEIISTSVGSAGTAFSLAKQVKKARPDLVVNVYDEDREQLIAKFNGEIQRFPKMQNNPRTTPGYKMPRKVVRP